MFESPAFQFYPKDWLSDANVSAMTLEQQAVYLRLLCHMWLTNDCNLPNDIETLSRIAGVIEGSLKGGWDLVLKCFQPNGNQITHNRLLKERLKQLEWRQKSSEGGKKSAISRKKQQSKIKGGSRVVLPPYQPKSNSPSPSPSPIPVYNKSPSEIVPDGTEKKEYGNENINKILKAIKLQTGLSDFTESQKEQRIWGTHLYQLMSKIQPQEFARRLDILTSDSFKAKRCNSLRFLYSEIKAFIEPSKKPQGIIL